MSIKLCVPNFPGKNKLMAATAKASVRVAKHSPEILVGVGVVGFIGTAVLASVATTKLEAALDRHDTTKERIRKLEEDEEYTAYTTEMAVRDRYILTLRTIGDIGKLYAPAVLLGIFSAACVIGGHHILLKRNLAITAAYAATKKAFEEYRGRVARELGDEREKELYLGVDRVMEEIEGKRGKKEVVEKKEMKNGPYGLSMYARCFDEGSRWWKKNHEMNKMFLIAQQNHANDTLRLQGHLFLNEVYDMLDIPRTSVGAVVGWVYGQGDSFVDFGIFDPQRPDVRDFINCRERNIWLDFNVDGVIYDLI